MNEEKIEKQNQPKNKKRGRKPKNFKKEFELNRDQTKFFVDLSKDKDSLEKVFNLLEEANKKESGREINFKDLSLFALDKINPKDIEKLQDNSLSKRERLEVAWKDFNQKNKQSLSFDDFLMKKVGLA